MRILILQYRLLNDGSTNALFKLFNEQLEKNDYLVVYSRNSPLINELKKRNIKKIRIPYLMSSDRGYQGLLKYLFLIPYCIINSLALLCLISVSLVFRPNIIHTNVSPIHLGFYLSKILNIPHVWHIREFRKATKAQPLFSYSYFEKLLRNSATIAVTKSIKDFYGLKKCKIIYDGVITQHDSYKFPPLINRKNTFLFVGRVEKNKGIEMLIDSFAKFSKTHDDWQLDVVGYYTESYYRELLSKINEYSIKEKVHFLGVCNDINSKMLERKVVVISSLSEGFGYVTVEAMYNGCFVIGNDNTGTKEQLDNAKALVGYDVSYRFSTVDELTKQMINFANGDYVMHQRRVNSAYNVVISLYSVEKYRFEVNEYYKQIIDSYK